MVKVKTIMIGQHATGIALSSRIVMTTGNGMVKSKNPILLKQNGGSLQMTKDWKDWGRGALKSMNWAKRKSATGK